MKMKSMTERNESYTALRNALIRRIDAALDAREPDMETVDLCSSLLDVLECGSCMPRRKRMWQELAVLAAESAYIPTADAIKPIRPMSVRHVMIGIAAVCVCLLLLPLSVMLVRFGSSGMTDGNPFAVGTDSTDTAAIHTTAPETVEIPEVFSGVLFSRGDTQLQYDDLAACLDAELPEVYYPTEFPADVRPTAVAVTEAEDGVHVEIGFGDAPYSLAVYPCPTDWQEAAPQDGCEFSDMRYILGDKMLYSLDAYEKTDEDGYYLAVRILNIYEGDTIYEVYEFRGADAETIHTMFRSMRRADTDHIHTWVHEMIPAKLEDGTTEYKIKRYCDICESKPSDSELVQNIEEMVAQKDEMIAKLEQYITVTEELKQSLTETLEAAVADRDKTNNDEDISFMEEQLSEMEKHLQFLKEELQVAIAEREFILSQNES